ncbi:NAD(P)-dependent dehydrogenase, short-chain alcohol dehydrogenase family [Friedmanniella luteola]|uniref:NAD(P)-dependent dehydrogenase, short-chain alcohol dehydrogenase family n=1 Tax=Friedmanniella luteola TaxID=546871 RepID=A0A1H1ZQA1_9ACTN|nr:SDR family oxidoreductase [Friedmanniella luteola]SDT35436.1 NAD(P)-dependent dehydrogenase, short-chain alcohol dehydrogenase family [Friedmanniella luteola]
MAGWPEGSVVVVTGGAGGVGHACAAWQAERGAQVFSLDRRRPADVVGTFVEVDVLDEGSVADAVATVVGAAGRIDGLVAAAGLSEEPTPAEDMGLDVWSRTIGVNLTGVFVTCQQVGRVMLGQGAGRIVTIASMSGAHVVNTPQQQVAYNASKGGLVAMTKSLAYEWASRGVRVNALSPGYVDTPLLGSKHDLHQQWKSVTPLRRFAEPAEVAAAAAWLLSDEAGFCCGTEMLMDGGYTLA